MYIFNSNRDLRNLSTEKSKLRNDGKTEARYTSESNQDYFCCEMTNQVINKR